MQTMATQSPNEQKRELNLTYAIHAPREQVWQAFTDPDTFKQWWGPHEVTTPVARMDVRVGGTYLYCMFLPDGQAIWGTGYYLEVVPPERLVMTDSFADEDGDIVNASYYGMSPEFPLKSVVTITFEPDGDTTILKLKYDDLTGISDTDLEGMTQGWTESFEKLDALLAKDENPACAI